MSVCVSVRQHISRTTNQNFTEFSQQVARGPGSVLFDGVAICPSGFVDDVMFSHNGPYGAGDALCSADQQQFSSCP